MKIQSLLTTSLAALASASLTQAGGSAERTAEKVLAEYTRAYNAGDSAALAQVYSEDAVMLPPNGVAYAAGIYSFPPGPKGPGPTDRGKFMVGLKKVSGSWKIAADIWNEARPAEH